MFVVLFIFRSFYSREMRENCYLTHTHTHSHKHIYTHDNTVNIILTYILMCTLLCYCVFIKIEHSTKKRKHFHCQNILTLTKHTALQFHTQLCRKLLETLPNKKKTEEIAIK